MTEPFRVFVGYDDRERLAYEVCVASMRDLSSIPLCIQPLDERRLRHAGIYRRQWRYEDGQFIDIADKMPFSTQFSFSRFVVPALCQWRGLALFCDCDFLWLSDIAELLDEINPSNAVHVVKHDHQPQIAPKMEGQIQTRYYRKNWSSLVVWSNAHPANMMLTPHQVNTARGQWLHSFAWLEDQDIGGIPEEWNYLVGHSNTRISPKAVHFTDGVPSMPGYEEVEFSDEWRDYARSLR